MPETPPLLEEQDSLNSWLEDSTRELDQLREILALVETSADFAAFKVAVLRELRGNRV